MDLTRIDKLISEPLTVEIEEAKSAGSLGFMARAIAAIVREAIAAYLSPKS